VTKDVVGGAVRLRRRTGTGETIIDEAHGGERAKRAKAGAALPSASLWDEKVRASEDMVCMKYQLGLKRTTRLALTLPVAVLTARTTQELSPSSDRPGSHQHTNGAARPAQEVLGTLCSTLYRQWKLTRQGGDWGSLRAWAELKESSCGAQHYYAMGVWGSLTAQD
jgi:hypothetical protein